MTLFGERHRAYKLPTVRLLVLFLPILLGGFPNRVFDISRVAFPTAVWVTSATRADTGFQRTNFVSLVIPTHAMTDG